MIYFESLTREVINILARFLIEMLKNAKWMKFKDFSTFSLKNLIFFNSEIIQSEIVTIPHPRMEQRNFVLIPLNEIAPNYIHPILNLPTSTLLNQCKDESHVYKKTID